MIHLPLEQWESPDELVSTNESLAQFRDEGLNDKGIFDGAFGTLRTLETSVTLGVDGTDAIDELEE